MDLAYRTVLLDFDGTVMNSEPGILDSAKRMMKRMGLPVPDKENLRKFIGPPIKMSIMETFRIGEDRADEAVRIYREEYAKKGMLEAFLYPGMEELLKELNKRGAVCAIASIKQEKVVRKTMEHFGLLGYFKAICGAGGDINIKDKEEIICEAIARTHSKKEDCILVGDSEFDANGALLAKIDFCAVMWGFGFSERTDMQQYTCKYIANSVEELKNILL